jgi:hypothetical protein
MKQLFKCKNLQTHTSTYKFIRCWYPHLTKRCTWTRPKGEVQSMLVSFNRRHSSSICKKPMHSCWTSNHIWFRIFGEVLWISNTSSNGVMNTHVVLIYMSKHSPCRNVHRNATAPQESKTSFPTESNRYDLYSCSVCDDTSRKVVAQLVFIVTLLVTENDLKHPINSIPVSARDTYDVKLGCSLKKNQTACLCHENDEHQAGTIINCYKLRRMTHWEDPA